MSTKWNKALLHALDCRRAGVTSKSLRIIHGKGTGALRERVAEMLRGDPRVSRLPYGRLERGRRGRDRGGARR